MIALRHDVLRSRSGGIARDRRSTPQRKQSGVVTRPQDAKRATRAQPLTARTAWYRELTGKPHSYSSRSRAATAADTSGSFWKPIAASSLVRRNLAPRTAVLCFLFVSGSLVVDLSACRAK